MTLRRILLATLIGCITLSVGCRHRCHKLRRDECSVPAPFYGSPPTNPGGSGGARLPPTNIAPPSYYTPPDNIPQRKPEILLPSDPPNTSRSIPRSGVIIYPPTGGDPLVNNPETASAMPKVPSAPSAELFPVPPAAITSPLPTGIADFAKVKENVFSGLKPNLDGLAWLKKNNYKSVLRLRKPTDTDEADQPLVEQQGLRFVSLSVAPETLDQNLIDQFNDVVGNASNRPILVYDKDGSLAGVMWYLHFRTVESLKDDEARLRAMKHGLRENGDAEQVALWLAVQKYLSTKE